MTESYSHPASPDAVDPYAAAAPGSRALEALEAAENYNRWVCSQFAPYLGATNIELGAGRGTLTAIVAQQRSVIPTEPADEGFSALQTRFRGNANVPRVLRSLAEVNGSELADCVYSSNVLEHIEDDLAVIGQSAALLKPGGHFVAVVPAGMWLYSSFDRTLGHFRRYVRSDRERIQAFIRAERLPFRFVEFRWLNPVGAFGWWTKMRLLNAQALDPADAMKMNALIPWLRHLDKLRLPFGQSIVFALEKS
jgi:2-polyprenyl-3-methyl-5-hydroxy-6-metoxy-1,4-benzoquinol methylase